MRDRTWILWFSGVQMPTWPLTYTINLIKLLNFPKLVSKVIFLGLNELIKHTEQYHTYRTLDYMLAIVVIVIFLYLPQLVLHIAGAQQMIIE